MHGQHTLILVLQWHPFKGVYFTENTQFSNNGTSRVLEVFGNSSWNLFHTLSVR